MPIAPSPVPTRGSASAIAGRRLAFFMPDLTGGGAEKVMVDLTNNMAERGAQVELVLVHSGGVFLERLRPDVKVVDLGARRALFAIPKLARYLRERQPEMLCAFLTHCNVVALLARRMSGAKTKVVITPHNALSKESEFGTSFLGRSMPWFAKRFYGLADLVVSVSAGVRDDVNRLTGLNPTKHIVIPVVGITQDMLDKAQLSPEHPWLVEKTMPVFTHFGRLTAQKDQLNLVEAFSRVRAERPARLIFFGEGEDRAKIQARVDELGLTTDVDLPGFTTNPFSRMAASDAVVLSSIYEGLPAVIIQALACGAPVVSTDCPYGPSEILENGKFGRLVPVSDPKALAEAMIASLDQPIRPTPESWERYWEWREMDAWESAFAGVIEERNHA